MPRLHCATPLAEGLALALPPAAARHAQVLRLQPGDTVTLFDGRGGEYTARVEHMGRSDVAVQVLAHDPVERELPKRVHIAAVMPANDRMDWLVEKATELGAASVQPLVAERSVLRLSGERAQRKQAHWQAAAVAACEQCGRNRVPVVHPVAALRDWLAGDGAAGARCVLSLQPRAAALRPVAADDITLLSGPEGGLSPDEEALAAARGFLPVTLGARVLRAETAPIAALALLGAAP